MEQQKKPVQLALFDFDGTLIPGDSIALYLRFTRRKGLVNDKEYMIALRAAMLYGLGRKSAADSKTAAMRFRQRYKQDYLDRMDQEFVTTDLLPKVYGAGRKQLEEHRAEGKKLVLVTASTENYMRYVAQALGFDALLASQVAQDGTVTGNCKGEEKSRRVRAWLEENGLLPDWQGSFAYGDSKSDLPMLLLCGHPVQVNSKKSLQNAVPEMPRVKWR